MKRPWLIALVAAALASGCSSEQGEAARSQGNPPDGDFAIVGADIIPMDADTVLSNQTIVVRNGLIETIGPADTTLIDADVSKVEATGLFVVPGLHDVHVHVQNDDELPLYIANGVTTVLNLHGTEADLQRRLLSQAGALDGPRYFSCGPPLRGGELDPVSARSMIEEIAVAGFDCAKIRGDWDEEAYRAASDAARTHGLSFIGHAPRNQPFSFVLDDGSQKIVHLEELVYTTTALNQWIRLEDESPEGGELPDDLLERIDTLAAEIAARDMWVVPTQIVIDNYLDRSSSQGMSELSERQYLEYLDPLVRRRWARATEFERHLRFRKQVALQYAMLAALKLNGVRMAAGTDAETVSTLNVMPGWSIHEELETYLAAGFSNYEALRTATVNAAAFIGHEGGGVLREGSPADFLVVARNPLEDLATLRQPRAVVVGGRWIGRPDIESMLAARAAGYAPFEARLAEFDELMANRPPEEWVMALRQIENPDAGLAEHVEGSINSRGYTLLGEGRIDEAIEVFSLNVESFPGSANAHDSLAEAWLEGGDRALAIDLYRRALEIDPGFRNAERMLRELGADP